VGLFGEPTSCLFISLMLHRISAALTRRQHQGSDALQLN
jgi:hypothetical protein